MCILIEYVNLNNLLLLRFRGGADTGSVELIDQLYISRRNRQTDSEYITLYGDHVSFILLYTSISFNDPLSGRIKALCCVFFYLLPNLAPPNLGHHLCNSLVPRIYCSMLGIDRSF